MNDEIQETEVDRTARMLRRIPIDDLEALGEKLGVFTLKNTRVSLDAEFFYQHGYTIKEYFEAATQLHTGRSMKLLNESFKKFNKKRISQQSKP